MTDFLNRQFSSEISIIIVFLSFRYASDKESISTDDWEFGHGRLSNAVIETYYRTVKSSILENHTNLRPTDFLMRNHKHIFSRFKADRFNVAHSSHQRKRKQIKLHDLNVKEI